jgi:uncharacterized protein YqjF (DUF2071 family)
MTSRSDSSLKSSTVRVPNADPGIFLTAEWKWLVMVNYICDPELLKAWLPSGTEIDRWNNNCLISLVGFQFHNTRVRGISFPFHRNFEEINLRFYVRRETGGVMKRGVVFIREFVPKPMISMVANWLYGENYKTIATRSSIIPDQELIHAKYEWQMGGRWHKMSAVADKEGEEIVKGSEEEFITEHFWGYVKRGKFVTSEYRVDHPRWQIYRLRESEVEVDFGKLYGREFAFLNNESPKSIFLSRGSAVQVYNGGKIET